MRERFLLIGGCLVVALGVTNLVLYFTTHRGDQGSAILVSAVLIGIGIASLRKSGRVHKS